MCNQAWEEQLRAEGYQLIAGVDEVGRGALAGPVFAAAVVLPRENLPAGINDSKQLSRAKREALAPQIQACAVAIGVARIEPAEIDSINILQATKRAMRQALAALTPAPDAVLLDALTLPDLACFQRGIIGGDAQSVSIAAASIVAKVARDAVMREYENLYPGYGFDRHVGYGTRAHWDALRRFGPSPIHRLTFRGVANAANADNVPRGQGLFPVDDAISV